MWLMWLLWQPSNPPLFGSSYLHHAQTGQPPQGGVRSAITATFMAIGGQLVGSFNVTPKAKRQSNDRYGSRAYTATNSTVVVALHANVVPPSYAPVVSDVPQGPVPALPPLSTAQYQ
ncbi:hypothetical protein AMTR_s00088p00132500 [Amborella trichopoda]|uniref:Uncharacterized protein n=1 Tax=Amborella trichopoda TaxID=13333 RepID=W1NVE0_AMBTC|nr:hypothetical protein AMTR_s00088p00132500 [Amborella trichopoda]